MCSSYVSCDLLIFDPGSTCTPKKAQMEQKVIIVFIENWKERALILTDFNSWMARSFSEFFSLFEFGHLQGFNWGQSWTKNPKFLYALHSALQGISSSWNIDLTPFSKFWRTWLPTLLKCNLFQKTHFLKKQNILFPTLIKNTFGCSNINIQL